MKILFHPPTAEVELSGDASELRRLAELLVAGAGRCEAEDSGGHILGQVALTAFCVHTRQAGAVSIGVDALKCGLCIAGDLERLNLLAANLSDVADMHDGGHLHVDYFPGHPYLASDSIALVVNSPHGGMPVL